MAYKETFWMACDSTEQLRAEYGPFHTREEAEQEAKKLGFGYLLRYEHLLGANEQIEEVRCIFVELTGSATGRIGGGRGDASHALRHVRRVCRARKGLASRGMGRYSRIRALPP